MIVTAISCPPGISFYTLPQLFIWKDWIEGQAGYRFGANRVPSGSFDDPDAITESGWTDVSFQNNQIEHSIATVARKEPPAPKPAAEATVQAKARRGLRGRGDRGLGPVHQVDGRMEESGGVGYDEDAVPGLPPGRNPFTVDPGPGE